MGTTRRVFVKGTAAVTARCLLGADGLGLLGTETPTDALAENPGTSASVWYDRPMRWAQLAFVEDDPGIYDQAFWLDYFKRTHCEAACLSAGGAVAFYPTEIPLHYRSRWLGTRDTFGDLMKGCRALGMNVVARTDAHACHKDMMEAHPDWIAVDEHGVMKHHPSDPDYWITCALGPYNFEFMTSVHQEIMRKYMADGIFTNRWAGSGMCFCVHCQVNFREFSGGLELPRTLDPQDPSRRQYIAWHQRQLFAVWRLWDAKIKEINPNASYIANAGGGALSELDMVTIGELAPTLFADRQARSGVMPPWANGQNGKEYRATMGRKAIVGIFSMGLEERYRWKDSVQSPDEIRLWVADGIAQGLRPWFTKFDAKLIDRRWLPVIEGIYAWHAANVKYLRNDRPLARVGMVYSQQTATYYGGPQAHAKVEDASLGFYQALIEARIPFEMVHDQLLDVEHTSQFRTLILPNIAALSTAQCAQIQAFVDRGGSVVATYETSLYDEWGVRRSDFGLASLFGVSYAGRQGPMLNSYLAIEAAETRLGAQGLVAGFADATRIINGANQVLVKAADASSAVPLNVIAPYPDLPMEAIFPRTTKPEQGGAFLRQVGKGRVVYLPGDIDRTFWEVLDADHAKLLRNAVVWATDEPALVTVEGAGIIDLAVWTQKDSMTVHLVNLTNPMMMKGPVREAFPIGPQRVHVTTPSGKKVLQARLLVAGTPVKHTMEGGRRAHTRSRRAGSGVTQPPVILPRTREVDPEQRLRETLPGQQNAEVAQIVAGRARNDGRSPFSQKRAGVKPGQCSERRLVVRPDGPLVDHRARCFTVAIDSVRARRENSHRAVRGLQQRGRVEGEVLVAPASAVDPANRSNLHGDLARRDQAHPAVLPSQPAQFVQQIRGRLTVSPVVRGVVDNGPEPQAPRFGRRRHGQIGRVQHRPIRGVQLAGLGTLRHPRSPKKPLHRARQARQQAVPVEDRAAVGDRRCIRQRRPGGQGVQTRRRNVRNQQR